MLAGFAPGDLYQDVPSGMPKAPRVNPPFSRWLSELKFHRGAGARRTMKNFLDALVAVLAGNATYFLLMPHLPAVARHSLFKEDWGLLVDFAICTTIFAAVKYTRRDEK